MTYPSVSGFFPKAQAGDTRKTTAGTAGYPVLVNPKKNSRPV